MCMNQNNKKPREVLVIGNGFDIALGLPTQYTDFMDFLRIVDPVDLIGRVKNGAEPDKKYEKFFLAEPASISIDEIGRFVELRKLNSWAQYYNQCNAEIEGWIDLEREMLPVLDFFKWLFEQKEKMQNRGKVKQIITQSEEKYIMAKILPKFVALEGSAPSGATSKYILSVRPDYCDQQYGVFKEKILDTLKKDLDDFIEMFRIYLHEIVCNAQRKPNPIIDRIKADQIINFNYVQSEMFLKNLQDAEVIHIHGDATRPKNMVLGVNEVKEDLKNDFLYFTKSFQRIIIKTNPKYRDYWNNEFNVTFFGHSLDVTDIDIIKPLYVNAEHVKVYYYKPSDREKKIQNLIKMVDIWSIENDVYNGRLELVSCGEER